VQQHRELFGDQAGKQLAEEIFAGRAKDLSALQTIAQVPDSSWLWKRIFDVLLSCIDDLDDDTFVQRLPELTELGQLNNRYMDKVL
ncbi:type I Zorya anti-phage system protein ZorC, partial [Pseudomonas aeruginosa]